jgi:hypothetical protein
MVNVIPLNDEKEHQHDGDCWCDPRVESVNPRTNLPYLNGPMIIHNSADCRESVERLLGEGLAQDKQWALYLQE